MKIAAIVQARLGASRLPGKVMVDLAGKPLLWHVLNHAKQALSNVILATPDKELAGYAERLGVDSFIGSERDVLDRYYRAALEYKVEHIVRLTADNPLVDPQMVKELVEFYQAGGYDWAANCRLKTTYPIGNDAEVFSFKALARAWRESSKTSDREHVTPYIYHHPEIFSLGIMESPVNMSYLRWTVDTSEDLENMRKLLEGVYANLRVPVPAM